MTAARSEKQKRLATSNQRLATALRRFALERHRYLNQLARSEHLTRAEFDALDFIQQAGQMMPTELADRLGLHALRSSWSIGMIGCRAGRPNPVCANC